MDIADWISFGQVSAERDENLSRYFFDNGVLQSVVDTRHSFLVLGRKGAGKTAVFQHLSDNAKKYIQPDDLSITLSLQDYNWNVHSLLCADGKASSLAYVQSWKYIIYLVAIKALIEADFGNPKLKSSKKLIERIYTSPNPSLGQLIGQKFLQLSKLKLPAGSLDLEGDALDSISASGGEIEFSDIQQNQSLQSALNKSIERISEIFEATLIDVLGGSSRIFVSFDRIDEAWDTASFESSQRIIAGLIGASEYISQKFRGSLRPIVFLREDIFDTLDINDKNKLRSDCGKLLAWSKDGLSRLILERVNFFARKASKAELSRIEDLFDRDQMRQQRSPFDYVMLRTMLRPRDFIKYFELIKQDMWDRKENPLEPESVNPERLECESIYSSEAAYSEWLVEELRDEWRVQFPRINEIISAIQNNGRTTFTQEEFSDSLRRSAIDINPPEIMQNLKFMFDNSIIGFRVGNSQQWKFKCFFKSQGFVDATLYKIHDGLHRGLNLKESRSTSNRDCE
ncbi:MULTISPECIES: ATPase [unclassified Azospirillum]|uniref:P-loop ATPase, Sll1717 family n=1 Tax=unclassified Azospirillum TaxID=2630922 RepID=UPI0011B26216|nr:MULTISPECIES: ATPase [unclassified Azospirillum]